jgi:hypothetical protein
MSRSDYRKLYKTAAIIVTVVVIRGSRPHPESFSDHCRRNHIKRLCKCQLRKAHLPSRPEFTEQPDKRTTPCFREPNNAS